MSHKEWMFGFSLSRITQNQQINTCPQTLVTGWVEPQSQKTEKGEFCVSIATNPSSTAKQSSKHMSLQVSQMTLFIPGKFTHTRVRSETFSCMNTLVNITNGDMNAPRDSNITGLSHRPLKPLDEPALFVLPVVRQKFQKEGQVEDGNVQELRLCFLVHFEPIEDLTHTFPVTVKLGKSRGKKKYNGIKQGEKIELNCFITCRSCIPGDAWVGRGRPSSTYHWRSMHGSAPKHHKHTHTCSLCLHDNRGLSGLMHAAVNIHTVQTHFVNSPMWTSKHTL